MIAQKTLKKTARIEGIGLHSGQQVTVDIKPAPVNFGVVFKRKDKNNALVRAIFSNVSSTKLATTLSENGCSISTVEHLLAAFCGLGIDNALVEVDGPELPILDGSALPYVGKLLEVGTKIQAGLKRFIYVKEPIRVANGFGYSELLPSSRFELSCEIDFDHPAIKHQAISLKISDSTFIEELCNARTFGFYKDIKMLHGMGLARGGSLRNAIVLGDDDIMNEDGLRCPDEFVRHKALDSLGDVFLLGARLMGHLRIGRAGHTLHHALIAEMVKSPNKWTIVSGEQLQLDLKSDITKIIDVKPRLRLVENW